VLTRLRFLTVGLSFVLSFIGVKMIAHKWVDIPEYVSLLIVLGILLLALGASLLFPTKTAATAKRGSLAD
jgi:tellurite resistance protein TerC